MSINVSMQRAQLLLQQRRYADAERELRQTLAADPHFAEAHALLAETLLEMQRVDEATAEAALAIQQDPQLEVGHFVMARVLLERNRYEEAEQAVLRAIELVPYPRSFGLHAAIRFDLRDWHGALGAADHGLSIDPENSTCLNLRAMALRQLGRHDEADRTLRGALESDPDDSFAHSNRGWSELQRGRPREAMTHFREALRLDPTNDHARAGLVEAMKARYLLYRIVLGYFLWMSRLAQSAQFAIIIGGWVAYQVLRAFARSNPQFAWVTTPLIIAYIAFAWMTWLASPLMNLALRLHPMGRHALSNAQRQQANVVGALLIGAATSFVVGRYVLGEPLDILAIHFALAALPGSLIFRGERGWPRTVLVLMTAAMVTFAVVEELATRALIPPAFGVMLAPFTLPLILVCVFGSQWVAVQRVAR